MLKITLKLDNIRHHTVGIALIELTNRDTTKPILNTTGNRPTDNTESIRPNPPSFVAAWLAVTHFSFILHYKGSSTGVQRPKTSSSEYPEILNHLLRNTQREVTFSLSYSSLEHEGNNL